MGTSADPGPMAPLGNKLGLSLAGAVVLIGATPGWEAHLGLPGMSVHRVPLPVPPRGRPQLGPVWRNWPAGAQTAIAFFRHQSEVRSYGPVLGGSLPAEGALWAAWPRRAGGHHSDITDNVLREVLLPLGLVDVKVAALGEDWSGLKFVWRQELRAGIARRHHTEG